MAALNFPNSPSNGQSFTTAGGITYQYNGAEWISYTSYSSIPLTAAGGTLVGYLTLAGAPTADLHAATKLYCDSLTSVGVLTNIETSGYLRGPASFVIDPATHNDNTGTVVIAGNLQVDGTTTTINSATLQVDDKDVTLASGALNKSAANGAGIIVDCGNDTNASILYNPTDNRWDFNNSIQTTGNVVVTGTVDGIDISTIPSIYAPLASPTLTGTPAAPTANANTNSTQIATTAYVDSAVAVENLWNRTNGILSPSTSADVINIAIAYSGTAASSFGGTLTAPTFSGALTGNATTATALASARNINGTAFDGSGDITVTAAAGTLTGATLNSGVTASSLTSVGTLTGLTSSGDLTVNTDALFVDASAKEVGIGTVHPTQKLDVRGNVYIGSNIQIDGTATLAGDLTINTDALFVDASAKKVGIGTASPAMPLEIKGAVTAGSGSGEDLQQWNIGSNNVKAEIKYEDSSTDRGYIFGTSTGHDLTFQTNDTKRLRIDYNGNVKIGGALPASPKITLTGSTGAATFAGAVKTTPDITSEVGFRVDYSNPSGEVTYLGLRSNSVNYAFGHYDGSSLTSSITLDGAATFKGKVESDVGDAHGAKFVNNSGSGWDTLHIRNTNTTIATTSRLINGSKPDGTDAFYVTLAGAAYFAGTLGVQDGVSGVTTSANNALTVEASDVTSKTRAISIDGKSTITSTYQAFRIQHGTDENVLFKYDGSATFGDTSGGGSGTGGMEFTASNGQIDLVNTNSGSFLSCYNRSTTSVVASITAAGAAYFAGNVGLGTTAGSGKLNIVQAAATGLGTATSGGINIASAGGAAVGRTNSINFIPAHNTNYPVASFGFVYTSASGYGQGDLFFATRGSTSNLGATERMRIDSSGVVKIGDSSTASPNITLTGSTGAATFVNTANAANSATYINGASTDALQVVTAGTTKVLVNMNGSIQAGEYIGRIGNGGFYFGSNSVLPANNGVLTDGTTDFGSATYPWGSATFAGEVKSTYGVQSGGNGSAGFSLKPGTDTAVIGVQGKSSGAAGNALFQGWYGTSNTIRFNCDGAATFMGNVLVGTNTADTKGVTIYGTGDNGFYVATTGTCNYWVTNKGSGAGNGHIATIYNDTTLVGSITVTTTSTAYNESSDYRLKENVVDIVDGITRVKQLQPRKFNFIIDPDTTVDGFIAHEAQAVVPQAITGEKDAMRDEEYEVTPAVEASEGVDAVPAVMGTRSVPDYQGIDQSKLVPLLTAALQEAIIKIETLEAKVTALENS